MRRVHINTAKPYDVHIDANLLGQSGEIAREVTREGCKKALIVTDSNVAPIYLNDVAASFKDAGYECTTEVIPAGESHKTFETLINIVNSAAEDGLSRKDVIVALGGGVVGDLAGFAAAVYMRGIDYIQIPTTVLAAVDSSVGGKTAVDIPSGKNLAGAFHQPVAVICDYRTFDSLSERDRNSGYAEIIKYGMIKDARIFDMLEGSAEDLIARCVEIKAEIVSEDEKESGIRQILNFGHTIGHAIEKDSDYRMTHGEAVAVGMVYACKLAESKGRLDSDVKNKLIESLERYNLSIDGDYDAEIIAKYMRSDKKALADDVNYILPIGLGKCEIERMQIEEIVGVI